MTLGILVRLGVVAPVGDVWSGFVGQVGVQRRQVGEMFEIVDRHILECAGVRVRHDQRGRATNVVVDDFDPSCRNSST